MKAYRISLKWLTDEQDPWRAGEALSPTRGLTLRRRFEPVPACQLEALAVLRHRGQGEERPLLQQRTAEKTPTIMNYQNDTPAPDAIPHA